MQSDPPTSRDHSAAARTIVVLFVVCVLLAVFSVYHLLLHQPAQAAQSASLPATAPAPAPPQSETQHAAPTSSPRAQVQPSKPAALSPSPSADASVAPRIFVLLDQPALADASLPYPQRLLVDIHYAIKSNDGRTLQSLLSARARSTALEGNGGALALFTQREGLLVIDGSTRTVTGDYHVSFAFLIPDAAGNNQEIPGVAVIKATSSNTWYLDSITAQPTP